MSVYSNELCSESFNTLKYDMSLSDFLAMEEYLDILGGVKEEDMLEQKKKAKEQSRMNRR